jgi:signal transduction histidine kinase
MDALKVVAGNLGAAIERKRALDSLRAASRAKDDFLANMSHELRTPLNHVIGFTQLVVDKHYGDLNETQEEFLNDALQGSRHLLSLINDILDLAKLEAGKMELEPTDIDLKTLLANSLNMVREKALKHAIKLDVSFDGIPSRFTADERKLKQILFNLLSNAVKFTPDGGSVCLDARMGGCVVRPGREPGDASMGEVVENGTEKSENSSKGYVEVSVSDTGIGINPEDLSRIFNRFDQVDTSPSRKYQGTGLGLSLAKCLVEIHGGSIWAESEGEGKGSTFRFTIPA